MKTKRPIVIANCSGFYGDKLTAAEDILLGNPIDVLTGDYLAELTTAILAKQKMHDSNAGYVKTHLKQLRRILSDCVKSKTRIVTNAGGLNPRSMALAIEELINEMGIDATVSYIDGDDILDEIPELIVDGEKLSNFDTGESLKLEYQKILSANVYLGAWGIKNALCKGADIVVCPRVTDAALVIGPSAWYFDWARDDFDQLAGALVAGHIIECGTQCTGGNYSFFDEVPTFKNIGYPMAEIESDGSFVITKQPGTGGLVSIGTVTSQLLYEIQGKDYVNPDVVAHFDKLSITQEFKDRVRCSGNKGSAPTDTLKVCMNLHSGYRNDVTFVLTGLDIARKAEIVTEQFLSEITFIDGRDKIDIELRRTDKENPVTNEEAMAFLKISISSPIENVAGRAFSSKAVEMALSSIPGFCLLEPPKNASPLIKYWPTLLEKKRVSENVWYQGLSERIDQALPSESNSTFSINASSYEEREFDESEFSGETSSEVPLGRLFGTRSGDKGGNANIGVWANSERGYKFLESYLTSDRLRSLLGGIDSLMIKLDRLPNIFGLNFVIEGFLGEGVSSGTRIDPQAKSLGEYLRCKTISVPRSLLLEVS
jgi:hypothetical protein